MTTSPLTDEQFEEHVAYFLKLTVGGSRTGDKFNIFVADARLQRAELMLAKIAFDAVKASCLHMKAELAKARAENERLRTILIDTLKQFDDLRERLDDPDNTFDGFSVAVNACIGRIKEALAALAPKASPEPLGTSEQLPDAGKDAP